MRALAAALLLGGCGDAGDDGTPAGAPVTFATFRADSSALEGWVDHGLVLDALAALRPDVLCLQDFARADALAERLGHRLLDSLYLSEERPVCDAAQLDALRRCAELSCGAPDTMCLQTCDAQFTALAPACQECVLEGGPSFDAIHARCAARTVLFRQEASARLMTSAEVLEAAVVPLADPDDGVMRARLATAAGEIEVLCAWPRASHLDALRDIAATQAPLVLLGDLGVGPPGAGFEGVAPLDYQLFEAQGFVDPFVRDAPACTLCADNYLAEIAGNEPDHSTLTDHILVRGVAAPLSAARVLDEELTPASYPLMSHYAAHYGLRVTLGP